MRQRFYLLPVLALLCLPLISFSQFKVSAEFRPRFEMDNGTVKPMPDSVDARYFVTQRTRLKFDFIKEKYQLRLSIQDVRYWGSGDIYSSTGVFGFTNGLDIQEAWFRLKLCEFSDITIGRQVLILDDQRLIAGRNWNQYGIAYDALRYTFAKNNWKLSTVVSYNTNANLNNGKFVMDEGLFGTRNLMKSLNFIHLHRVFNQHFEASILAVGAAYQATGNKEVLYMTGTYGFWLGYKRGIFDVTANLYYQNGRAQSGKEVFAYMATVDPGVKAGIFRMGVGADYISGDNAENDDYGDKERTFNRMYGAVFKYYGYMNYYSYMKASTANGGLVDLYPNIKAFINKKHSITAMFHKFYLANPVFVAEQVTAPDQDLGAEFDLVYSYKPMQELHVQVGFSYYFTTTTLEQVKQVAGSDISNPYWGWVMITFTPQLFVAD